ncbi:hypothetical protein [Lederbergia panacisoli]|uniref:hypothetical protein n=1 Tax=Lederbergia panacisoli TaxID=1255251 RepID=UPI00214C2D7B|nr:hypothetical protein [Lederbergia panacisoli]MCR2823807.1 hypothetical protein [Lederbergia panacisoli]
MRAFITTLSVLACVVLLAAGHFYWKNKTDISSFKASADQVNKEETEIEPTEVEESELVTIDLFERTVNWPSTAQADFRAALESGGQYKLAIVGSPALGKETGGWSAQLQDALVDTYGDENIEVGIFEYDLSSDQFISGGHVDEIAVWKPDFVLFEPFNWIDNAGAPQHNSGNIEKFADALGGAVLVLQPPHPVYNTSSYPAQVGTLKEFAESEGFEYWDHWSEWPDIQDPELETYIQDRDVPNEKGHELWFTFLKNRFIAD